MQMSWRRSVIDGLLSVYGFANRRGLLDAPIAREAFARSYFLYKRAVEDPFAALVRRRPELFCGGHILDVGANIGYTATVFASALSDGFKVFAFEPEEKNYAQLRRTVARLGLESRVDAVHSAVGARDGVIELWRNEEHHGDHRIATPELKARGVATHEVPLVSLDRFVTGQVSFVKIDVQGYETEVLAGMKALLAAPITIAIEYMPEAMTALGFEPELMLETLSGAGFELHALAMDGSFARFDPWDLGERGYVDLLCLRPQA